MNDYACVKPTIQLDGPKFIHFTKKAMSLRSASGNDWPGVALSCILRWKYQEENLITLSSDRVPCVRELHTFKWDFVEIKKNSQAFYLEYYRESVKDFKIKQRISPKSCDTWHLAWYSHEKWSFVRVSHVYIHLWRLHTWNHHLMSTYQTLLLWKNF